MRITFLSALLLVTGVLAGAQRPASPLTEDKYIWLEDVSSPRAMEWVNEQNERSMKIFQADPHWKPFVDEALALASNPTGWRSLTEFRE